MGTLPTKMPTRESLGQAPSGALRRSIPSIRLPREALGAATGAAMAGFGKQISNAADAVYDHDQRTQAFETERNFQEWEWEQKKSLDDQARNIQPGQAKTFADDFQSSYLENGKQFYKTVPEHLKPFYEAKMMRTERELFGSATQIGRTEQKRFSVNSLGDTLNNVYGPQARTSTTEDLDKVTGNFERLVRANPDLTPVEADEINRKARRHIALNHLDGLPPDEVKTVLGSRANYMTGDLPGSGAMTQVATPGGLKVTVNKKAAPAFQGFLTDLEDAGAPIKGVGGYNERKIAGTNTWSQHAYGNAIDIDQSGRNVTTEALKKWGQENPDLLAKIEQKWGMTGGQNFRNPDWGHWEWGGRNATTMAALSDDDRKSALSKAETAIERQNNKASIERGEQYERTLLDADAGIGRLIPRSSIENDEVLTEQRRNALLKQHDTVAKTFVKIADFAQRLENGGTFNPYNPDDRKGVDLTYKKLGEDMPALKRVVELTGMVPTSVATKLRGDLVSNNVERTEQALQMATSLSAQKPTIFAGIDGHKELDDAVDTFRTRVDQFGMTSKEAAQKAVEEQSPEYQAKKNTRIKSEDIDDIVKKKLSVNDIRSAFDDSFLGWRRNPDVAFDPKARLTMYSDYTSIFRDHYMENGDVALSKGLALKQLNKLWGVSEVSGSKVVMRYPPEKAAAFEGIEKASEKIATQAIASIKEETGEDVTRNQLRFDPVPGGRTSRAYWGGEPPPYLVSWQDKNGTVHTLNPGRAFVPDPKALRDEQSTARQTEFEAKAPQAIEYSEARRNPVSGATPMRKELNAARRKLNARGDTLPAGGGGGGY